MNAERLFRRLHRAVAAGLVALVWAGAAAAQGFAGLGAEADGFAVPERGVPFAFPADHGPHPDYRIEWWYVTANLNGPDSTPYGIQWTLFRSALSPPGADPAAPQVWMGHAALTTPDAHRAAERLARGGTGQAGVEAQPFRAWIDEWEMAGPTLSDVTLTASAPDFAYRLTLSSDRPFVPQGDGGYSVKSASGQASYYYSQPFYTVAGTLILPEGEVAVTGTAWLDREWSSQPLEADQSGWDWFSLSLDSGDKVMGFRLRQTDGSAFTAATWIAPDGTPTPMPDGAFRATPVETAEVAGRSVPVVWRVSLPSKALDVEVRALNRAAWMDLSFPYWEGPVTVEGSHGGVGYLEMTGYE
ncbi:iron ABC transporter permease [Rhodobacteraceae bacterium CCMM004]|nr:iron ABC transporter permease [Rhodobacteraceae bacterium CCMM004]